MTLIASSVTHLRRVALPSTSFVASWASTSAIPNPGRTYSTTTPLYAAEKAELTKTTLIKEIAEAHELKRSQAEKIINSVFDTIVEAVGDGKDVKIHSFGTFQSYTSKATTKNNPITQSPIQVPAKQRIRFKPFKAFKDLVQQPAATKP